MTWKVNAPNREDSEINPIHCPRMQRMETIVDDRLASLTLVARACKTGPLRMRGFGGVVQIVVCQTGGRGGGTRGDHGPRSA